MPSSSRSRTRSGRASGRPSSATRRSIERLKIPVVVLVVRLQGQLPYAARASRTDRRHGQAVRPGGPRPVAVDRCPRRDTPRTTCDELGFHDVEVIGCPSMFLHGPHMEVTKRRPTLDRDARIGMECRGQVKPMGEIITVAHRSVTRTSSTSPRTSTRSGSCCGASSSSTIRRREARFPAHRSHPPAARRPDPVFFVDPWPWFDHMRELGLRVRDPDPRQHRRGPGRDPELRPRPRHADARAVALLRAPAPASCPTCRPDIDAAELYAEADYGPLMDGHAARFRAVHRVSRGSWLRHVFEPGEDPTAFDGRSPRSTSRRRSGSAATSCSTGSGDGAAGSCDASRGRSHQARRAPTRTRRALTVRRARPRSGRPTRIDRSVA